MLVLQIVLKEALDLDGRVGNDECYRKANKASLENVEAIEACHFDL